MKDMQTNDGHADPDGGPAQCGTSTTPPCPRYKLLKERSQLIYLVAGTRIDRERIHRATEEVDAYLVNALRGARLLARSAQAGHAATAGVELIEIEIEADIEIERG